MPCSFHTLKRTLFVAGRADVERDAQHLSAVCGDRGMRREEPDELQPLGSGAPRAEAMLDCDLASALSTAAQRSS
jgi:hypothetical protein